MFGETTTTWMLYECAILIEKSEEWHMFVLMFLSGTKSSLGISLPDHRWQPGFSLQMSAVASDEL